MPRFHVIALVAAVLAAILGVPVPRALAADSDQVTWAVRPADKNGPTGDSWAELSLDPGEETTEYLELSNYSAHPVTFELHAADGYFTSKGRFNMQPSAEESVDGGTWITVEQQVTVDSKGSVIIPYQVAIPATATPGDHAAGIAASLHSVSTMEDGSQVGVDSRVGFRVMMRVSGEITPSLTLVSASATYAQNWNPAEPGSAKLTYTVKNTGNTRLTFADSLAGQDQAGSRGELLPGETRTINAPLGRMWPLVTRAVDLEITATVTGAGEGADIVPPPLSQNVRLWTLPFPQAILVLALALVAFALTHRRRVRRADLAAELSRAREEGRREAREELEG